MRKSTTQATVPIDREAERQVVACAVASSAGARLAAERLSEEEFYDRTLARAFEVAVQLDGIDEHERRIALVVELAGVNRAMLVELVAERSTMVDAAGRSARRVRDTARRRRVMALAAELYNSAADLEPDEISARASAIEAEARALSPEHESPLPEPHLPPTAADLGSVDPMGGTGLDPQEAA
jgi:replicative DNA helicase